MISELLFTCAFPGEVFDYLVSHGRMKELEARAKFRQVICLHHSAGPMIKTLLCYITLTLQFYSFVCFLFVSDCVGCSLLSPEEYSSQRSEGIS